MSETTEKSIRRGFRAPCPACREPAICMRIDSIAFRPTSTVLE